ncbi:MAG: hypothetical protein QXH10_10070 [Ignisphaera sp.]
MFIVYSLDIAGAVKYNIVIRSSLEGVPVLSRSRVYHRYMF